MLLWCFSDFSHLQVVLGSPTYYGYDDSASLSGMVPEGSRAQTGYEDDYLNKVVEEPQPKIKTLRGQRILNLIPMLLKPIIDIVGGFFGGMGGGGMGGGGGMMG